MRFKDILRISIHSLKQKSKDERPNS